MDYKGHKGYSKPDGSTTEAWSDYTCGHCGTYVSGAVIAYTGPVGARAEWLVCTKCGHGSYRKDNNIIYPGQVEGPSLTGVPEDVYEAYNEARNCMSVNAFNATELICRKILMHVAVEKGAEEGKSFAFYLDELESLGYITPPMKKWVDIIRKNGNSATHKIEEPNKGRAMSSLMFTAELLRIIYEMEHFASTFSV
ncbi:conserved protein of unknown function [Petrocella atlantisensis]|uniref:DUF4145 domain-containing protein n=1 Tax=Petrocella atlantisensis TaxID=2173034 RepID=A0A3P7P6F6_9FIRM|nr:DUF4145 domain-containing protein [Petrocella atlantisensis]VDN49120.1 conserved protein of unknown function [Petrocella atlantisensis]